MISRLLCSTLLMLLVWQQGFAVDGSVRDVTVWNPLAIDLVTKGKSQDLNALPGGADAQVLVKLVSIPKEGDCAAKSRMVCSYDYFLGVMEKGRDPGQTLFYLGEHGSIASIKWGPTKDIDSAELSLDIANYPEKVLKRNSKLKKVVNVYKVQISREREGPADQTITKYKLKVVAVKPAKDETLGKPKPRPKKKKKTRKKADKNKKTKKSDKNKKPATTAKKNPPKRRKKPKRRKPKPKPAVPNPDGFG